jgi:hypothetical protein
VQGLPEPGDQVAGYRIERQLGRGGMGVVYLAEQTRLQRRVALKLIAPDLAQDEDFRRRFERESQLAASIDHPNVIPVFEAGEADGALFISMRYVDGHDLRALIAGEGRLDGARAARLVSQMGGALDAAHARGLVHRDVKPANVLVSGAPGGEHAYLTDFGLTKHVSASSGITHTGQWVGTLDYVAPEQIAGGALDARVDVYSLGCVLFQALTGQVPYPKESDVAKMYAHMNEPPMPVSQIVPWLPPAFDEVIGRALAKRPEDRYLSAGDLGRAAVAAAAGEHSAVPERSVAQGGAAPQTRERVPAPIPAGTVSSGEPAAVSGATARLPDWPAPPPPPVPPPVPVPQAKSRWPLAIVVSAVVLALGGVAAAVVASGGGGSDGEKAAPAKTAETAVSRPKRLKPKPKPKATPPPITDPEPADDSVLGTWQGGLTLTYPSGKQETIDAVVELTDTTVGAVAGKLSEYGKDDCFGTLTLRSADGGVYTLANQATNPEDNCVSSVVRVRRTAGGGLRFDESYTAGDGNGGDGTGTVKGTLQPVDG